MYVLINVQVVNVCTCNTNTELGFCGQCLSLLNVKQIWQASITWQITLGRKLNLLLGICLLNDFFCVFVSPTPQLSNKRKSVFKRHKMGISCLHQISTFLKYLSLGLVLYKPICLQKFQASSDFFPSQPIFPF